MVWNSTTQIIITIGRRRKLSLHFNKTSVEVSVSFRILIENGEEND